MAVLDLELQVVKLSPQMNCIWNHQRNFNHINKKVGLLEFLITQCYIHQILEDCCRRINIIVPCIQLRTPIVLLIPKMTFLKAFLR